MADINKEQQKRGPGRPFEKGKSGNPGGRPKGIRPSEILKELITDIDEKKGITPFEAGIQKLKRTLLSKKTSPLVILKILEFIRDSVEGKPIQKNEQIGIVKIKVEYINKQKGEE